MSILDIARKFLKHGRGRSSTTGACRDDAARTNENPSFAGVPVPRPSPQRVRSPPGSGVSENTDRVADTLSCSRSAHVRRRRCDDSLRTHASFGEPQMQCVIRSTLCQHHNRPRSRSCTAWLTLAEITIRSLGKADFLCPGLAESISPDCTHRLMHDLSRPCTSGCRQLGIFVHHDGLASPDRASPSLAPMRTGLE